LEVAIWPFAGPLQDLLVPWRVVVAETYPAEFYNHLGIAFRAPGQGRNPVSATRPAPSTPLPCWPVLPGSAYSLTQAFALDPGRLWRDRRREDRFDAVIGLFGMLNILRGDRQSGEPTQGAIRRIEG
jgi:hypothetical protein